MFRTTCIHQQEDHLYMHFCMVRFSCIYVSSLAGWRMCLIILQPASTNARKTYHTKLHVQYSLPDDEHMMFETCRRHEELN